MPGTLNPKTLSGIHHSAALQIEGQKAEQARRQQEQAALSKLERIRLDQTQRAQTLEEEAKEAEQKVRKSLTMGMQSYPETSLGHV